LASGRGYTCKLAGYTCKSRNHASPPAATIPPSMATLATRRRPATSADVARHAGVSRATVSYVLNRVPDHAISDSTAGRVQASARELGYVPHLLARSLRSGTSKLV